MSQRAGSLNTPAYALKVERERDDLLVKLRESTDYAEETRRINLDAAQELRTIATSLAEDGYSVTADKIRDQADAIDEAVKPRESEIGTLRDHQARAIKDLATTGAARVEDIHAILGDPTKGVSMPDRSLAVGTGNADVIAWLRESQENAERIASTKIEADRDGWLEDASYLRRAIEAIQGCPSQDSKQEADRG